ncbi:MAG: hypothetical protein DRO00_08590, partial [Thermoproteota archaeon]
IEMRAQPLLRKGVQFGKLFLLRGKRLVDVEEISLVVEPSEVITEKFTWEFWRIALEEAGKTAALIIPLTPLGVYEESKEIFSLTMEDFVPFFMKMGLSEEQAHFYSIRASLGVVIGSEAFDFIFPFDVAVPIIMKLEGASWEQAATMSMPVYMHYLLAKMNDPSLTMEQRAKAAGRLIGIALLIEVAQELGGKFKELVELKRFDDFLKKLEGKIDDGLLKLIRTHERELLTWLDGDEAAKLVESISELSNLKGIGDRVPTYLFESTCDSLRKIYSLRGYRGVKAFSNALLALIREIEGESKNSKVYYGDVKGLADILYRWSTKCELLSDPKASADIATGLFKLKLLRDKWSHPLLPEKIFDDLCFLISDLDPDEGVRVLDEIYGIAKLKYVGKEGIGEALNRLKELNGREMIDILSEYRRILNEFKEAQRKEFSKAFWSYYDKIRAKGYTIDDIVKSLRGDEKFFIVLDNELFIPKWLLKISGVDEGYVKIMIQGEEYYSEVVAGVVRIHGFEEEVVRGTIKRITRKELISEIERKVARIQGIEIKLEPGEGDEINVIIGEKVLKGKFRLRKGRGEDIRGGTIILEVYVGDNEIGLSTSGEIYALRGKYLKKVKEISVGESYIEFRTDEGNVVFYLKEVKRLIYLIEGEDLPRIEKWVLEASKKGNRAILGKAGEEIVEKFWNHGSLKEEIQKALGDVMLEGYISQNQKNEWPFTWGKDRPDGLFKIKTEVNGKVKEKWVIVDVKTTTEVLTKFEERLKSEYEPRMRKYLRDVKPIKPGVEPPNEGLIVVLLVDRDTGKVMDVYIKLVPKS